MPKDLSASWGKESDLLIALAKARKDFAAVQAWLTVQNDSFPSIDKPNDRTHKNSDMIMQAAKQLAIAMRQIINNLISNAVKYSPTDKPVRVSLVGTDKVFRLRISDEGIGIPEADLKHIFEPFHRATNVGTISGTGLGLIISQKAVELHGGTIAIQSHLGTGTTITVEIPVVTEKENERGENSGN